MCCVQEHSFRVVFTLPYSKEIFCQFANGSMIELFFFHTPGCRCVGPNLSWFLQSRDPEAGTLEKLVDYWCLHCCLPTLHPSLPVILLKFCHHPTGAGPDVLTSKPRGFPISWLCLGHALYICWSSLIMWTGLFRVLVGCFFDQLGWIQDVLARA
jgi:hypothetical protein